MWHTTSLGFSLARSERIRPRMLMNRYVFVYVVAGLIVLAIARELAGQQLIAPDLYVFVLPQTAAYDPVAANLQMLVIATRGTSTPDAVIQPGRIASAKLADYVLYGVSSGEGATVAAFPLSAVAVERDIRVSFSQVIRGSSALTHCKDCSVALAIKRLR